MTDTPRVPPEPNWADYIDALRGFEPPTLRLARRQRALEVSSEVPSTTPSELPPATEGNDAGRWWRPPEAGNPRK
jgi:hypothetical protein